MAKKYIDAEKLERHFENCICEAYNTNGVTEDFEIALKATKNQPAADVQEVVRCKDCKYFLKYKSSNECFCYKGDLLSIVKPDDYCSQSVRIGDNMNEI